MSKINSKIRKLFLFDLDGTVLDTVDDISAALNHTLHAYDIDKKYSADETKMMLGNGLRNLLKKALGNDVEAYSEDMYRELIGFYYNNCDTYTRPYPGMQETIDELIREKAETAIISNKLHSIAVKLINEFYPEKFSCIYGASREWPSKPDPFLVNETIKSHNIDKDNVFYIGDSDVDIETAHNAGIKCISVAWGFRSEDFLWAHNADTIIQKPSDIIKFL